MNRKKTGCRVAGVLGWIVWFGMLAIGNEAMAQRTIEFFEPDYRRIIEKRIRIYSGRSQKEDGAKYVVYEQFLAPTIRKRRVRMIRRTDQSEWYATTWIFDRKGYLVEQRTEDTADARKGAIYSFEYARRHLCVRMHRKGNDGALDATFYFNDDRLLDSFVVGENHRNPLVYSYSAQGLLQTVGYREDRETIITDTTGHPEHSSERILAYANKYGCVPIGFKRSFRSFNDRDSAAIRVGYQSNNCMFYTERHETISGVKNSLPIELLDQSLHFPVTVIRDEFAVFKNRKFQYGGLHRFLQYADPAFGKRQTELFESGTAQTWGTTERVHIIGSKHYKHIITYLKKVRT